MNIDDATKTVTVCMMLAVIGYLILDTFTSTNDDDILCCVVFLTFSTIPMCYLVYNYYSDLAINLSDYLYGFSNRVTVKAATLNPVMRRWGLLT